MKKMVVLVMMCLVATISMAASIAVTNPSLEDGITGKVWWGFDGQNNQFDVPGWSSGGAAVSDSGVEQGSWVGASDGICSGYLMTGDPSACNLTDYVIAAGDAFQLKVDLQNNWSPSGCTALMQVALYYDVAGVRNVLAQQVVETAWGWPTVTLDAAATAESVGNKLGVELKNVATGGTDWLGFDNVRLNVVPEPATMVLLGLGGLLAARSRKQ